MRKLLSLIFLPMLMLLAGSCKKPNQEIPGEGTGFCGTTGGTTTGGISNTCDNIVDIRVTDFFKPYNDAVDLETAYIDGDYLKVKIQYGGGCNPDHNFIMAQGLAPLTQNASAETLELWHEANGDGCKALLLTELCFSLQALKAEGQHGEKHLAVTTRDHKRIFPLVYKF